MTATALPQDFAHRSWNGLVRVAAVAAVLVLIAITMFALGRGTADSGSSAPATVEPAGAQTVTPPAQDPCTLVHSVDC
jgi:hypothetical protein